jgi:hypothetical protein
LLRQQASVLHAMQKPHTALLQTHMPAFLRAFLQAVPCRTCCQQVLHTLDGQEPVRVVRLADAIKEDGQVVVVVQLVKLNLGAAAAGDGGV